jgi:uncharacterized protein (DUF302 family)
MSNNAAAGGLRILATQHSVPEALRRVRSMALERGLTVFAQIDFSGDAQRSGLSLRPILAWQDSQGRNWLAYNEPEYLKMRHDIPPELLKNIAGLGALAAAAAAPEAG